MATIKFDAKQLLENLENAQTKSEIAIHMYAQEGAKKFENYAKTHRQWTDRTGHAKQRLVGWVETLPNRVRIIIGHGVDYGVFLELCNEKRFAILQPTVNALSREIVQSYKRLIGRMKP